MPEGGRCRDEHAVVDERYSAGHHQSVREFRALIHPAITIGIGQDRDRADGGIFADAIDIGHVAAHLDHPDPAVGPDLHGDGIEDERIGGDDFDLKAGGEVERFQGLLDRQGRRRGNVPMLGGWPLRVVGAVALLGEGGESKQREAGGGQGG